jgi:hypothetical protein
MHGGDRYDIGPPRTPVPTIEKGFSIEFLAFTVIFLGLSGTSTPTTRDKNRHFCFPQHKKAPFFKGAFIVLFLITSW